MNEKDLPAFIAGLPEHLRFFFTQPPAGMDDEEFIRFTRQQLANTRQYRDELVAHGIRADDFLADMEPKLEGVVKACADVETSQEALLQATADKAEAEHKLFLHSAKAVKAMVEENPFDPKVQELREQMEELAKNFPKC